MTEPTTITYTITADRETHGNLIRFLKTAQLMGIWGCSRTLCMPFDGDGSAFVSVPGLSKVPFDRSAAERETDTSDRLVNVGACVPDRGVVEAFLGLPRA